MVKFVEQKTSQGMVENCDFNRSRVYEEKPCSFSFFIKGFLNPGYLRMFKVKVLLLLRNWLEISIHEASKL